MGMFPDPTAGAPGSPDAQKASDLTFSLLKKAHRVLFGLASENVELTESALRELNDTVSGLDLTDRTVVTAISSMIMTMGTLIPPTAYGDSIEDWEALDE